MAVYQTYVNAMNDKIRKQININNPFVFKHISNLKVPLLEEGGTAGRTVVRGGHTAAEALCSPASFMVLGRTGARLALARRLHIPSVHSRKPESLLL
jgi:hypothetical protein